MDLSRAIILKDSSEKIDFEKHFKLCAGPGAGKTTFIINHIYNIINNSKRISKVRKIACITYTNIAVDTIKKRLENSIDYVEVNTIHSFLYKNVVKPYLWALKDEYEFDYEKIDGHDEIIPTYSILKEWKDKTNQWKSLKDDKAVVKALINMKWKMNGSNISLEIPSKYMLNKGYNIRKSSYIEYKKVCWKRGMISHDDVLYLSYKIIEKQPRVCDILRAKFPYIIIDEFQDTNPIQTKILKKIAKEESVLGVIGDVCQSIYSFQGATVEEFDKFKLKNMNLFKIENNYRSTQEIIDVLNMIRNESDFNQISVEGKRGEKPYILVGDFIVAYNKAVEISKNEKVYSLAYKKETVNKIKYNFTDGYDENILLYFMLSDNERGKMIVNIIYSLEYCRQNKIKEAIKFMKKAYRKISYFDDKDVLLNLHRLINNYDTISELNIKEFYNTFIYGFYNVSNKISNRGDKSTYYENLKYKTVAISIDLSDDNSISKTIHKAKGAEYDNVFVCTNLLEKFDEDNDLSFLINPDMKKEADRVYYVAMSRAKKRLFINVPNLSQKNLKKLEKFNIIYL